MIELLVVGFVFHALISMRNYYLQQDENRSLTNLFYDGRSRSRSDDDYLHTRINRLEAQLKELKK
jgi:hypothetical protein